MNRYTLAALESAALAAVLAFAAFAFWRVALSPMAGGAASPFAAAGIVATVAATVAAGHATRALCARFGLR